MKLNYTLFCSLFALAACSPNEGDVEKNALNMLNNARMLMQNREYHAARDTIFSMRQTYPKAFQARTAGIIVLDSIELMEAQDSILVLGNQLRMEEDFLSSLQSVKNSKDYDAILQQKKTIFHLKQHIDEVEAKVKFFLRKIDIDQEKGNPTK